MAHDVAILAIKAVIGGGLVAAFSLLAESVTPKRFAGLFGAAPAVALAGLSIVLLDKGAHDGHQSAVGMLAGSAGMIAYAAAAIALLKRFRASLAALGALAPWLCVAALVALPVLLA